MASPGRRIRAFLFSDDGPSTVEYAVMLALIVMVAANAIQVLGCNVAISFTRSANAVAR